MLKFKQVIIVNSKIKMSPGKMAAQVAHASVGAYLRNKNSSWVKNGMKKVILKYDNLEELEEKAKKLGLISFLVRDAGLTELEPGTITALGIGPAKEEDIDKVTKDMPLL